MAVWLGAKMPSVTCFATPTSKGKILPDTMRLLVLIDIYTVRLSHRTPCEPLLSSINQSGGETHGDYFADSNHDIYR